MVGGAYLLCYDLWSMLTRQGIHYRNNWFLFIKNHTKECKKKNTIHNSLCQISILGSHALMCHTINIIEHQEQFILCSSGSSLSVNNAENK